MTDEQSQQITLSDFLRERRATLYGDLKKQVAEKQAEFERERDHEINEVARRLVESAEGEPI